MSKRELSTNPSNTSAIRSGFLRRRVAQAEAQTEASSGAQAAEAAAALPDNVDAAESSSRAKRGIMLAKKYVEIESGVEVLEDMIPSCSADAPMLAEPPPATLRDSDLFLSKERVTLVLPLEQQATQESSEEELSNERYSIFSSLNIVEWRTHGSAPIVLLLCFVLLLVWPLHDFLRGILATIVFILLMDTLSTQVAYLLERFILKTHPERQPFQIPNYDKLPICEIPAVEEHKTIKTYAGWLNEINSYDPNTFSFTMTRAVYVRLDGTVIKLSGTNARIPKRRMWNEPAIDRTKVLFTDHRSYDLKHCRIELLPVGLARKRFFNRKYPIQLIIKNSCIEYTTPAEETELLTQSSHFNKASGSATPNNAEETDKTNDFAATVLQADLEQLRNDVNPDKELRDITVPCGEEVRLLLFARCDREKEDWYRRFTAASKGKVHEQELHMPMAHFVDDTDLQAVAAQQAINLTMGKSKKTIRIVDAKDAKDSKDSTDSKESKDAKHSKDSEEQAKEPSAASSYAETEAETPDTVFEELDADTPPGSPKEGFEGMIMSADVARNPAEYVKFMTIYQSRRAKRKEDELWKGINQSLFLGPSGSVVWANILLGRCLFSCLNDAMLHEKIKEFMQKKLNSIKLPSFMEEVVITNIYLGEFPLLFHRISQPMLDERGVWLDADMTYEGMAHITVTTKLNLLRIRSKPKTAANPDTDPATTMEPAPDARSGMTDEESKDAIYDSDAESVGGSSSESESPTPRATQENANNEYFQNSPGNARRIFKIVDRIAASNLFQYATELPYVQRAMENMSANITLRVDLKGMVARGTLNIPPPPSDRVWMCFRGPPRLWISTKPQVGDKSVDWSIVTNVIESKLCEAVNKFLVYPNMVDFTIPFLSKPNYEDEPTTSSYI
ncbi:CG43783 [Drosophila busckii]|uniref:CG43783 n=1 Tax=Drosophila busckii TaxID=30019 RepID=A0A0M4EC17_DROBS|nr:CG43783 [Drosophila busckii]